LDIDGWLREIGLEQYAQTFRDNAINADVLCKAIGEPPEDPLLLFLLLTGYVVANGVAGNVEACRDVATGILSLAEKQQASAPLVLGHICVGYSLLLGGEITDGKAHLDQTIALYDPAEHRLLHFGIDQGCRRWFGGRMHYGCLAILRPRVSMQIVQSRTHAPSVTAHL